MRPSQCVWLTLLVVLMRCDSGISWSRRRRRRSCDATPCQWKWSECSVTCGTGERHAIKTKNQGSCGACDMPTEVERCNLGCCQVHCSWEKWGNWSPCSSSCGQGSSKRSRTPIGPSCNGSPCKGPKSETKHCENGCCPTDCVWNAWTTDGSCSATCGGGQQLRKRSKAVTEQCGGRCIGESIESVECGTKCCEKNCKWGPWAPWGSCDRSCGTGFQTRSRDEKKPATCGGKPCEGETSEFQRCNEHECKNGDAVEAGVTQADVVDADSG